MLTHLQLDLVILKL